MTLRPLKLPTSLRGNVATLKAPTVASLGRPKKKKRKRPARLDMPLDCAVLAIDAAETSGYAMWRAGQLLSFGEVDVFGSEPGNVLDVFLRLAGPHVLVVERPFMVRSNNSTGIGTADKIWRELAKRRQFAKRIVRVYPNTWRAAVLPRGTVGGKREQVRAVEMAHAQEVAAYYMGFCFESTVGPDSAPAILIGKWAMRSGEVLAVLPKVKPSRQLTLDGVPVAKKRKARAA